MFFGSAPSKCLLVWVVKVTQHLPSGSLRPNRGDDMCKNKCNTNVQKQESPALSGEEVDLGGVALTFDLGFAGWRRGNRRQRDQDPWVDQGRWS